MNIRKLENWNWKQNFNTLEDATEFLLDYTAELGPLSQVCINRLKKKEIIIQELTKENKSLKNQMKGVYSNDKRRSKHQESI